MKRILQMIVLVSLSVMCFGQEPQSLAASSYLFISNGNWNDGTHWNTGEVPPEGSDVIIMADAVIPAGYTAIANQVNIQGGSITVADGGQLKHNTQGLVVTMEKSIAAFNEVNSWSNYYLLAFPFSEDVAVPATMTAAEDNDFYTFDPDYPNAEWRNNKQHVITTVGGTTGYLYANPEDIELSLTGSTYQSYGESAITVEVPYTEGSSNVFNGWALLGNPFTCNAYVYALENGSCVPKEYMVYNAEGELVRCSCSSIAPMQGFFVKVEETTTICIKTTGPYVDLGLPSGTLWATCNVGANAPEEYGDYFAWGETQPKEYYDWSTYQYCNGNYNKLTKYCDNFSYGYNGFIDNLTTLLPEDDAARTNWGNDWRMPTIEEWQELYNNTSCIWTTLNGMNGLLFTSVNGNSLFLPAAGCRVYSSIGVFTSILGYYWSSSLYAGYPHNAWYFYFDSDSLYMYYDYRYYGRTVRAVRSSGQSTSYVIDVTANPVEGGEVSGGGTYQEGTMCILTATAEEDYTFTNWTENGEEVSSEASYSFPVNGNRNLIANFAVSGSSIAPMGAIDGKFTINSNGDQVYFSQGNLQYIGSASTPYWKFADNQWDYFGTTTGQNSSNQNVDRDLFGWGTSGYAHGALCYWPWSTTTSNDAYYAYGNYTYNLYDQTGKADWGYHAINNGGNQPNQWKTLTMGEWAYVFNTRTTISGIRYAKAKVNNVKGVVLLPDDWSTSYYSLSNINSTDASFSSNTITAEQWSTLEQHGAVFLPAAGWRTGTSVISVGGEGDYWSASCSDGNHAYCVYFRDSNLNPQAVTSRYGGKNVRLVRFAQ